MLLGTLGASLLGNVLIGKGIERAGSGYHLKKRKGIVRAGYGNDLKKRKAIVRAGYGNHSQNNMDF